MDAFIQQNFPSKYFDENAEVAKRGNLNNALLGALKDHPFFEQPFPKTTGPELFNLTYLENAKRQSGTQAISLEDTMATLNRFSADMIVEGIRKSGGGKTNLTLYSSGGGMHNPLLMENIKSQLPGFSFLTTRDLHINPDAKEAVLFATLANECVCGGGVQFGSGRNGIPSISMGKISFPN
jgi:anhydro-N-acetylmuramic acid kinase